jgi:hypothetical protein
VQHDNSWDAPVIFILGVVDSATHLHGATSPTVHAKDLAACTSAAGGLGLTLLLLVHHQVELLDTVVARGLKKLDMVVAFAVWVGQPHQRTIQSLMTMTATTTTWTVFGDAR